MAITEAEYIEYPLTLYVCLVEAAQTELRQRRYRCSVTIPDRLYLAGQVNHFLLGGRVIYGDVAVLTLCACHKVCYTRTVI